MEKQRDKKQMSYCIVAFVLVLMAVFIYMVGRSRYLYAFFKNDDQKIQIYTGWRPNAISLYKELQIVGRDPSILRVGEYYYIAVTEFDPQTGKDFVIYKTKDFNQIERHEIKAGLTTPQTQSVWAPDLFQTKDGKVGVVISVQAEGNPLETDKNGNEMKVFDNYTMILNLENMTVSTVKKLLLDGGNKIDGHIFWDTDSYRLLIKDEKNKEIELWSSNDFVTWSQDYDTIPQTKTDIEGAFVIKSGGLYTIYTDEYPEGNKKAGGIYFTQTRDFKHFSSRQKLTTKDHIRHGSGLYLPSIFEFWVDR